MYLRRCELCGGDVVRKEMIAGHNRVRVVEVCLKCRDVKWENVEKREFHVYKAGS